MKKYHNMTGESIEGEHPLNMLQKQEPAFDFWDLIITLIFLVCFFGSIYLYFQNRTLKHEIEQKHLLIMDLGKLLEKKNGK